jgi:hypothetical protein
MMPENNGDRAKPGAGLDPQGLRRRDPAFPPKASRSFFLVPGVPAGSRTCQIGCRTPERISEVPEVPGVPGVPEVDGNMAAPGLQEPIREVQEIREVREVRAANVPGSLVDLLDRVLGRGLVLHGGVVIALAGVDLLRLDLRLLVRGVRTVLEDVVGSDHVGTARQGAGGDDTGRWPRDY